MKLNGNDEFRKLHSFEIASLANLVVAGTTPEEAIAWVPSLSMYEDEYIVQALECISRAKSRLEL